MKNLLKTAVWASVIVMLSGACGSEDDTMVVESLDGQSQAACSCPSGWDCTDLDAGNTPRGRYDGYWYHNQPGFTRYDWPERTQKHAILTNSWLCTYDKDKRLYFFDNYFANPANAKSVFVRWNPGYPGYACSRKRPAYNYLNGCIGGHCGDYLRVTIGQFCPHSNVAVVAK